jgi:hypothetical protein
MQERPDPHSADQTPDQGHYTSENVMRPFQTPKEP